mmetsp:Transcript_44134/g.126389  ORF Transcript_44134/g.126389 Transcript_44134/m.126389 type:complete len:202 (+) Transcript_44134:336-941(+)
MQIPRCRLARQKVGIPHGPNSAARADPLQRGLHWQDQHANRLSADDARPSGRAEGEGRRLRLHHLPLRGPERGCRADRDRGRAPGQRLRQAGCGLDHRVCRERPQRVDHLGQSLGERGVLRGVRLRARHDGGGHRRQGPARGHAADGVPPRHAQGPGRTAAAALAGGARESRVRHPRWRLRRQSQQSRVEALRWLVRIRWD